MQVTLKAITIIEIDEKELLVNKEAPNDGEGEGGSEYLFDSIDDLKEAIKADPYSWFPKEFDSYEVIFEED